MITISTAKLILIVIGSMIFGIILASISVKNRKRGRLVVETDGSAALVDLDGVDVGPLKSHELVELEVIRTDILAYVRRKGNSLLPMKNNPQDKQAP